MSVIFRLRKVEGPCGCEFLVSSGKGLEVGYICRVLKWFCATC